MSTALTAAESAREAAWKAYMAVSESKDAAWAAFKAASDAASTPVRCAHAQPCGSGQEPTNSKEANEGVPFRVVIP